MRRFEQPVESGTGHLLLFLQQLVVVEFVLVFLLEFVVFLELVVFFELLIVFVVLVELVVGLLFEFVVELQLQFVTLIRRPRVELSAARVAGVASDA